MAINPCVARSGVYGKDVAPYKELVKFRGLLWPVVKQPDGQPQFEDGPPVPLMVEGMIDADTLRRLFADLSASATVLGVREKSGPAADATADEPPPEVAMERLLARAARGSRCATGSPTTSG